MNRYKSIAGMLCAVLAMALLAAPAQAEDEEEKMSAMETVKETSEAVLCVLRDPELEGKKHKEERHRKVRGLLADAFDWRAMAQRGLGRHWRDLSEEEQTEFTGLFRKLLEQIYIKRIEKHATDAEVRYVKEEIEDDRATVYTEAAKGGKKAPINYIMRTTEVKGEEEEETDSPDWLIYDVKVEGVSLLLNYREQFNEIIIGSGYDTLVEKLRKKVGED